jgi:hypothetical protein
MSAFVTAGAGFLLAVLWFDLMFDVQLLARWVRELPDDELPEEILASIAGYYRRVTTAARPMNRLVALVMLATIAGVILEIASGEQAGWVSVGSLALVLAPTVLAAVHTVPSAVRLGGRSDSAPRQSALARSICRDHLLCAASIAGLLALQLTSA